MQFAPGSANLLCMWVKASSTDLYNSVMQCKVGARCDALGATAAVLKLQVANATTGTAAAM